MTVKQAINEAITNGWTINNIKVRHANGKKPTKKENIANEKVVKMAIVGGCGCCGVYHRKPQTKKIIYIN